MDDELPPYSETQQEWYFCCPGDDCPYPGARKYCLGFLYGVHAMCVGILFCYSPPNLKGISHPVTWVIQVIALLGFSLVIILQFLQMPIIIATFTVYGWLFVVIMFGVSGFEFPVKMFKNTGLLVASMTVFFWIGYILDNDHDLTNSFLDRSCIPARRRQAARGRGERQALLV
ncbi:hypothetical protein M434DRAFT_31524 [Hypoxylon sp. CO27-5]|nr:hypothetical protein M434DRAFT_31524 [Hypoxylon sp. CO27-5]